MLITPKHLSYIIVHPMFEFARERKIKISGGYSLGLLAQGINEYSEKSKENEQEVCIALEKWLHEGQKKILFRYFKKDDLKIIQYKECELIDYLNSEFEIQSVSLEEFHSINNVGVITNIKYNFINTLKYLEFEYLCKVEQKNKETDTYHPIPILIHVEIDFENLNVVGRIHSRSELYLDNQIKTSDVNLLENKMIVIMRALGIDTEISAVQKSILQRTIYRIHEDITALPEEITLQVDAVEDDIMTFEEEITSKLGIENDDNVKDEITRGIKDVLLKNIIAMNEDKAIFKEGKYAISTGINASGQSKSMVRFQAPAYEPIQSNPEYQHISNIMGETEKIKQASLFWNSERLPGEKIRMKIYAHSKGYIQICFEQYVYEEDIENVLSKIREFI